MRRRRPAGLEAAGWCFTLGLLVLAQARSDDGASIVPPAARAFSIEILVRDQPVLLHAPLDHDSHYLAESFCRTHNLSSSSAVGQACENAVEEEVLREYHRYESQPQPESGDAVPPPTASSSSTAGSAFSHIRRQPFLPPRLRYRPERDNATEVVRRLESLYGSAPPASYITDTALHGQYVPVSIEGLREVEWEGRGRAILPGRFDVPAQAQRLCAHFQMGHGECPVEEMERLLSRDPQNGTTLVVPPGPSLSLDLDLEWSPGLPRRFVLYSGQEVVDAAIAFCARHQCPDRLNTLDQIIATIEEHTRRRPHVSSSPFPSSHVSIVPQPPPPPRVVVSMSTLPSRLPFIADRIWEIKQQTRRPDHIYLCLPHWSLRERAPYHPVPQALLSDPEVTVVWSRVDWGPATKLIPTLDRERDPRTMVITMDDDVRYPEESVAELVANAHRLPNSVLGYMGFTLPRGEDLPLSHEAFAYREGCNETSDQVVDVLGGVGSVLYRVGFLDRSRLTDYIHYPSAAFYVDDEWIAAALEEAGVPRVVLSRPNAAASACPLMEGHNLLPYAKAGSALNGPAQAHRNMEYQTMVLRHFRDKEGLWPTSSPASAPDSSFVQQVFMPHYYPLLGRRAEGFRFIFDWLQALNDTTDGGYEYAIVETGTISDPSASRWAFSGQATLLFDRFINHYQGRLWTVDLDEEACRTARSLTSQRTVVMHGDSVQALWTLPLLPPGQTIDLVYLDSYDVEGEFEDDEASAQHHLKELAAVLPRTRMLEADGPGTLIVVDDNLQLPPGEWRAESGQPPPMRGKGRLVQELLHGRCKEVLRGWQVAWVCGGREGRMQ